MRAVALVTRRALFLRSGMNLGSLGRCVLGKGTLMAANNKQKLKLLAIMRMLQDETDSERGLTMRDIIERLEAQGIEAERKSVYRDIETLREFGLDIATYQRSPVQYAIAQRDFSISELMLMVDAVESSRFLTRRQCDALVRNIKLLASDRERALLDKRIHVAGRVKSKNDSVFRNVDAIHEALRERRKVSFLYFKLGPDRMRQIQHDGKPYVLTPVKVVYAGGFYYATMYSDSHEGFADYRIDRMHRIVVTDEPATRNELITRHAFDDAEYQNFGRFGGDPVNVVLDVAADKVDIVFDRFGDAVQVGAMGKDGDEARVQAFVTVRRSEQFFGWVAGLGGTVKISEPRWLVKEYRAYLQGLIDQL